MGGEPRNAASDKVRTDFPKFGDRDFVETELLGTMAADFVREDRRRIIAFATATREELVEFASSWFDVELGQPQYSIEAAVAVRGDRLALMRWRVGFVDGASTEMLALILFDPLLELTKKLVVFDVDDVETALAVLDELHAEL